MQRKWNARADTPSIVIMWAGSLLAAIICILWFARSMTGDHIVLDDVENELSNLQHSFSTACNMNYFKQRYNPRLAKGWLLLGNDTICIDANPCTPLYYASENEPEGNGSQLIIRGASVCKIPKGCKAFYYRNATYQESGGNIILQDAIPCEQKSISRCRLLVCDINLDTKIDLSQVVYITIEKNATFSISLQ